MAIGVLFVLLICFLLVITICIELRKFFINRKLQNFDLVKGTPFIGIIGRILGTTNYDIIGLILQFFDETKTTAFRLWIGPVPLLGVYDPKSVEILLTNEHSMDKPFFYEYLNCKTSLVAVNKERWKSNRRALNPAFSLSALNSYIPHFNETSRILVNRIQPYLNKTGDFYRYISVCMTDTTIRTMLGVNMDLQSERGDRLYEIEKKILNSIQYRFPRIWLRYDFVYHNLSSVGRNERRLVKYASDVIEQIYQQKVEQHKRQGIDVNNFLEKCIQLERQGIYSHLNVIDELSAALIAGNDTPTITLFGTLLMLAINQRHQELVVDELRSIFESADCDVTPAHLTAMNYTERVIKESQRLLAPAPFIARQTSADIDLPNGTVPKNTIVIISTMHVHRNPQVWGENALEFDPDRFLPENSGKRSPFSFIPFSAGPRNCIGLKYSMMSVKTVLAHLLRKYRFETDLKFEDIELYMHIVLDIANKNPLRIKRRDF